MIVYQCKDTLEDVFTAVYLAYEEKRNPEEVRISLTDELFLFAEYREVTVDVEKACKVIRTLRRRFGEEDYYRICLALASKEEEKAQAVYRTIVWGLKTNPAPGHLLDHLTDDYVRLTFQLARNVSREEEHLRGFLRFSELKEKILYAQIGPHNNILTFLMPHFADRFPGENFIIEDVGRNLLGIHPVGKPWFLINDERLGEYKENMAYSSEELCYSELFRHFCHTITIEERRNRELQRNMLPLRFREFMVEFSS